MCKGLLLCDEGISSQTPRDKDEKKHHGTVDDSSMGQQFQKLYTILLFLEPHSWGLMAGGQQVDKILVDLKNSLWITSL